MREQSHDTVANIDQAVADTIAELRGASGKRLTELGAQLADQLDHQSSLQLSAFEELHRTAARIDRAVRELRDASSSSELMHRACRGLAELCGADRVLLSGLHGRRVMPVAVYDRNHPDSMAALPGAFTIEPGSPEAQTVITRPVVRVPHPNAALRGLFHTECTVLACTVDDSPIALLHINTALVGAEHDLAIMFTEVLGACFAHLALAARRARQLDLLRTSARTWIGDLELPAPTETAVDSDVTVPQSVLTEDLTEREIDVLRLILTGASNATIAVELVITVDTVKSHIKRILRKLGATNRRELIAKYDGTQ